MIAGAENRFKAQLKKDADADGVGEYGSINALLQNGLLGRWVPSIPNQRAGLFYIGYIFRVYLPKEADNAEQVFAAYAWPENPGGGTAYFIDQTGAVQRTRMETTQYAGAEGAPTAGAAYTGEAFFSDHSHGFRPGRKAHDAVRYVQETRRKGYRFAVDADLSKFFDRVNHDVLMRLLARHVKDPVLLRLIGKYLRAGVVIDGKFEATTAGVPQGGPLSPLLANVVLHELDCELERRGHRFARYADDFVILVKSHRAGERVLRSVQHFLAKRLRLELNEAKSGVVPIEGCEFLGFTFRGKQIRWSNKAEREFKRRVRRLTSRSWGVSMEYRLAKLSEYVRGWMGYFGVSEYYTIVPTLDEWLRRRVRLCYWKMWKKPRRRIRQLLKLGVDKRHAILTGLSRKGYWRLSRTLGTQSGITNAWLAEQGVISLKVLWVNIHYPDGGPRSRRQSQ